MKKIFLFASTLIISSGIFAQTPKFGLKAGLNVATLSNNSGSEMGSRLGFNGGVLAHIHIAQHFALQPEVVYSSQGAKYTISDGEHSLGLNYVNIPVLLQYMFDNGFRLQTGPQLGFLAGVKDKRNGTETGIFTSDDFKTVDISWAAGLGYLTYSGLGVDARYNFGLNNINDAGNAVRKNNVFQIGLFYMLDNAHKAKSK